MSESLLCWLNQVVSVPLDQLAISPLAAEASYRQFYRLRCPAEGSEQQTWIVMDSPPDKENNRQFCHLAAVFSGAGLPVPDILAADHAQGFYLLTDLGERDLETAYQQGDRDAAVGAALATLAQLQQISDPQIGPYTEARFADELEIFRDWYVAGLLANEAPESLEQSFSGLVSRAVSQPQCCIHRDYHCRNLLYSTEGRFGIVDFQDALHGPATYDIASLLRDCYYRFEETQVQRWLEQFLKLRCAATGMDYPVAEFRQDLDYCAVQRQLKAIGIFARLHLRDGKSSHLRYIRPLQQRLISLCGEYAELGGLAGYLAELDAKPVQWLQ